MRSYEQKLIDMANMIKDDDVRDTMKVVSKNKLYPKDCLTNGALEVLINKILKYEKAISDLGGKLP